MAAQMLDKVNDLVVHLPPETVYLMHPSQLAAFVAEAESLGGEVDTPRGLPFERVGVYVHMHAPLSGRTRIAHVYLNHLLPQGEWYEVKGRRFQAALAERLQKQQDCREEKGSDG